MGAHLINIPDFNAWDGRIHQIKEPVSIYEVHLGSFKMVVEEGNRFLTYKKAIKELISYLKEMDFTHIELLPLAERSLDESWGYQATGYFSPTSRYGTTKDLMEFVNQAHKNGIGVILDWVQGHFPTDGNGLSGFDGTALYEHQTQKRAFILTGKHQSLILEEMKSEIF